MKRRKRVITVVVLFALAAAGLVVWRMTAMAPSWYAPPDRHDPQVALLADKVENRLLEEAQKVREPSNTWTLRVRENQINAWLANRLPQWIEHEQQLDWPDRFGTPQVRIDSGGIELALPLKGSSLSSRCLVAHINPAMNGSRLALVVDRMALGRLSLPGRSATDLVQTLQSAWPSMVHDAQLQQAMAIANGQQSIDPEMPLADRRRLRLLSFQFGDGWIDLKLQTLQPGEVSLMDAQAADGARH